jgi:hypothetical protein
MSSAVQQIGERRSDSTALYKAKWNLWPKRQYQAQDGFGARPGARAGEPVQRSGDGGLLLEA